MPQKDMISTILAALFAFTAGCGAIYTYLKYWEVVHRLDIAERSLQSVHARLGKEMQKTRDEIASEVRAYLDEAPASNSDEVDMGSLLQLMMMQQQGQQEPTDRMDATDVLLGSYGQNGDQTENPPS